MMGVLDSKVSQIIKLLILHRQVVKKFMCYLFIGSTVHILDTMLQTDHLQFADIHASGLIFESVLLSFWLVLIFAQLY